MPVIRHLLQIAAGTTSQLWLDMNSPQQVIIACALTTVYMCVVCAGFVVFCCR